MPTGPHRASGRQRPISWTRCGDPARACHTMYARPCLKHDAMTCLYALCYMPIASAALMPYTYMRSSGVRVNSRIADASTSRVQMYRYSRARESSSS